MPQVVDAAAFRLTPDLRFLFAYGGHEEAFAKLADALQSGKCLLLVTGPFGVGKTLLLRRLEARLMQDGIRAAYAAYPQLDFAELLAGVAGLDAAKAHHASTTGVILIDDADRCSGPFLQNLQDWMVSAREDARALSFVMAGSPSLASRLAADFPTLSATIGTHAQIEPLNDVEADAYIRHRLEVSGQADVALHADARDAVIHYSRGIPRLINHACARALLLAGPGQPLISQEIAREAIEDYVANASFGQTAAPPLPVAPSLAITMQDPPTGNATEAVATPKPASSVPAAPRPPEPPAAPTALTQPEPLPEPAAVADPSSSAEGPAMPADLREEAAPSPAAPEPSIEIPPLPAADGPKQPEANPASRRAVRPNRLLRSVRAEGTADRLGTPAAPLPKFAGFRQRRALRHDHTSAEPSSVIPPAQLAGRGAALKRTAVVAGLLVVVAAALYVQRVPEALSVAMRHGENLDSQLAAAWQAARTHAATLAEEIRRIAETLKI